MKKLISLIVVFFLSVFGVAATAEPSLAPEKLVMDVSTQVLDEIKKDPALAAADPAHVNQLVDKKDSALYRLRHDDTYGRGSFLEKG